MSLNDLVVIFVRTRICRMSENKKRLGRPEKKVASTRFEMRLDVPQKEAWEISAKKEGKSVAAWLKELGNKKANYMEDK